MDEKPQLKVALFDFDGTLRQGDAFLPFLCYVSKKSFFLKQLIKIIPYLVPYLLGCYSRKELKEEVLIRFLKGRSFEEIQKKAFLFAQTILQTSLKQKGLEYFYQHKLKGHKTVLVSANLDIFIKPFGSLLGFDSVLATDLEVDEKGLITGKILGNNCWGAEKVRKVVQLLGPKENYEAWAYGDSEGDRELFIFADHKKKF